MALQAALGHAPSVLGCPMPVRYVQRLADLAGWPGPRGVGAADELPTQRVAVASTIKAHSEAGFATRSYAALDQRCRLEA